MSRPHAAPERLRDSSYFVQVDDATFTPTEQVSGAWNPDEQHIAPALGLMVHMVETDRDSRRDDGLVISRLCCDILGTVPMDKVEIDVAVRRPGRTMATGSARHHRVLRPQADMASPAPSCTTQRDHAERCPRSSPCDPARGRR